LIFSEGRSKEVVAYPLEHLSDDHIKEVVGNMISDSGAPDLVTEADLRELDKLGPRSMIVPWQSRKEDLLAHFNHEELSLEDSLNYFQKGVEYGNATYPGATEWRGRRGRLVTLKEASKFLVRPSTAGLPFLKTKGNVLDKDGLESIINSGSFRHYSMLYSRSKSATASRNVWGYAVLQTLMEYRMYPVMMAWDKSHSFRAAMRGTRELDKIITGQALAKPHGHIHASVDYSSFDTSVSPRYLMEAMGVLASVFHPSDHEYIFELAHDIWNVKLVTPDGIMSGPHGMPSGTMITNTIDSVVQVLAMRDAGVDFNYLQLQGDDCYGTIAEGYNEAFITAMRSTGFEVHPSKSLFNSDIFSYNSRFYWRDNRLRADPSFLGGSYGIGRAVVRLKYPERFTDFTKIGISGESYWALAALSKLSNCVNHPQFETFVKWYAQYDPKILSWSQEDRNRYKAAYVGKVRAGIVDAEDSDVDMVIDIIRS